MDLDTVTTLVQSVHCLHAHMLEDAHAHALVTFTVNDALVHAVPNVQQVVLQFVNVMHWRLIDSLLVLDDIPYLVVDRIEFGAVL